MFHKILRRAFFNISKNRQSNLAVFYACVADVVDLLLSVADSRQIPTTRMMKTFDEFKASREKMDLSTRQMSEHQ